MMGREIRIPGLRRLLRLPPSSRTIVREVDDELRFHLDSRVEDLIRLGMSPDQALERAHAEFGDLPASRGELVAVDRRRLLRWRLAEGVETTMADVRYALRQSRRASVVVATIVAVLAVGIGANTAAFTLVRAFTTRPAPAIPHPEQLARLVPIDESVVEVDYGGGRTRSSSGGLPTEGMSLAAVNALAAHDSVFEAVGGWIAHPLARAESPAGSVSSVNVLTVTDGYFPGLRLPMARGVSFGTVGAAGAREEDVRPIAVVSYAYWQRELGGDSAVAGRVIRLNGIPLTIVGVVPRRFNGLTIAALSDRVDVWVPMSMTSALFPQFVERFSAPHNDGRPWRRYEAFVRVAPGVSPALAAAVASRVMQRDWYLAPDFDRSPARPPDQYRAELRPLSGRSPTAGPDDSGRNILFLGAVGVVILLISCATAASLLVARAVVRRREIAIRLSLGAARERIIRQLLTESALLAAAAMIASFVGVRWITAAVSTRYDLPIDITPDRSTIVFGFVGAAVTALLFGSIPAFHATRASVSDALKTGATVIDVRGLRWQGMLTVVQIALGSALVCATGVFVGAAVAGQQVEVGIPSPDHVITAQMDKYGERPPDWVAFREVVRRRILAIPGVTRVAWTDAFPLVGGNDPDYSGQTMSLAPDGTTTFGEADRTTPWEAYTEPELFAAAGIPIIKGRAFERGLPWGPAVITADLAQRLWPSQDPIGRTFNGLTVVGVVPVLHMSLDPAKPSPVIFVSHEHAWARVPDLLIIRTAQPAVPLVPSVRRVLAEFDPRLSVHDVRTLEETRAMEAARLFDASRAAAVLSVLALIMATAGIVSVVAFSVSQRTREIGIRMALGAHSTSVTRLFVKAGMRLTLAGIAIGIGMAWAAVRIITHTVGGTGLVSYASFAAFVGVVPVISAVAIWIPARRAARVDPVSALRAD